MDDEILMKDLPGELIESVVHTTAAHTVAFVRLEERDERPYCTLLGSRILIAAGGVVLPPSTVATPPLSRSNQTA